MGFESSIILCTLKKNVDKLSAMNFYIIIIRKILIFLKVIIIIPVLATILKTQKKFVMTEIIFHTQLMWYQFPKLLQVLF